MSQEIQSVAQKVGAKGLADLLDDVNVSDEDEEEEEEEEEED